MRKKGGRREGRREEGGGGVGGKQGRRKEEDRYNFIGKHLYGNQKTYLFLHLLIHSTFFLVRLYSRDLQLARIHCQDRRH